MSIHIHFSRAQFLLHFPKHCFWTYSFPQPSLSRSFSPLLFTQAHPLTLSRQVQTLLPFHITSRTAHHPLLPQIFAPRTQPALGCPAVSRAPPHLPDL